MWQVKPDNYCNVPLTPDIDISTESEIIRTPFTPFLPQGPSKHSQRRLVKYLLQAYKIFLKFSSLDCVSESTLKVVTEIRVNPII